MREKLQLTYFGTAGFVLALEGFLVEQSSHVNVRLGEDIRDSVVILSPPLIEQRCEVEHLSRFDFITNS